MSQVDVIIVNYNAGDRLARCLSCLNDQTYENFRVTVIDNKSQDGSMELAKDAAQNFAIDITFVDAGENLGFAAANNRIAETATGEWLAFLNPDAYAKPDWLEKLVAASSVFDWADAFGSTQLNAADPSVIDGAGDVFNVLAIPYRGGFGWDASKLPPTGECFAPCAAAAMYRRERFAELGGFDERFFCYGEDVDLGFRLRLAGGRAVQIAEAVVLHEGSGVTGRHSDFTVYHGNRNKIWIAYKNLPGVFYWPLLPFQIAANLYVLARSSGIGSGPACYRGLKDAVKRLGMFSEDRRLQARNRKVSLRNLARVMAWSPLTILRRAPVLRDPVSIIK